MKPVDLYARVRHACRVEGLSQRETARRFGIDTKTVRKMLTFAVPPGYRRSKPPARPKLDPFTPIINRILEADRSAPPKQRHTAKLLRRPPPNSQAEQATLTRSSPVTRGNFTPPHAPNLLRR